VKAFQLVAHGNPGRYELRDLVSVRPVPGEVLVDVQACGLNRLDLWLEQGSLPIQVKLPRTPGGEIAGVVSAVGESVQGIRLGDRVAIQSNLTCGACEYCRRGEESLCLKGTLLGVDRDGGLATKVLVPAPAVVQLPPGVDFQTSAALTLAGSTAMHMLTNRTQVHPGDWVLVMGGASGVGSSAIQIARQLGARVISTGSTEAKRALALRLGAEFAVDSTEPHWPVEVRKLTGRRGVDLAVEHIGGNVLRQVFDCLARGGTIVTCGATAGRDVMFQLWPFFVKQHRLIGSYGRNLADIRTTLEWATAGRLKPVIDAVFPLAAAGHALQRLRDRAVLGKVLITP
jgi:NADPH:quinone reductase-like Zn-dependent oxidoreductase